MRSALPVQVTVGILIEISPDSTRTRNLKKQAPPQKKKTKNKKNKTKQRLYLFQSCWNRVPFLDKIAEPRV